MADSMDEATDDVQTIAENEAPESTEIPRDSMVTVRLSEPPSLTLITQTLPLDTLPDELDTPSLKSSGSDTADFTPEDINHDVQSRPARPSAFMPSADVMASLFPAPVDQDPSIEDDGRRGSESTDTSVEGEVNWAELEKTEEKEPRDQDSEDSTALLLARLEQENNLLVKNPKSGLAHATRSGRRATESRPPSMQQLKKLVNGPTPASLRYSLMPAPPMTDLEFYTALVQDYKRTAQRLPTLLARKIRSGVPPPLRGVVWQSMSGARDRLLEDQYDRLSGESSPYEGMIGKDIGRSFPGVEMFRDPEGDGQRMLGRVLKCFSLHDDKIGYCQGLGFLVGPLLMHMGDRQAFCVLVRLMEHYDLRSCFLPDLSGLHVRIYQFRELLKAHLPILNAHLESLQVEPTYVSQWFLSFFAVTCPLPMLFRVYDVIFAEGASETIMRVALSVMRKNEEKILACTEFEDIMQLLLSRGLWDCYHYNADEFVNDFVSLTGVVTNESLQALKANYQDARALGVHATPSPDVGSAASRFLGRLWSGSTTPKSTSLSPGLTAPARPVSFLRRSPSKQSIASTLNSAEGGSESVMSSTSTDITSVSRDSSNTDSSSIHVPSAMFSFSVAPAVKAATNNDKHLHAQIEGLVTALSELQRENAGINKRLQTEQDQRSEDRKLVRSMTQLLRQNFNPEPVQTTTSDESLENENRSISEYSTTLGESEDGKEVACEAQAAKNDQDDVGISGSTEESIARLVAALEIRFSEDENVRASTGPTKTQLHDELVQTKEKLAVEGSKSQELNRRLNDMEKEIYTLKEQVKAGHTHARNTHQEKQRLEVQIAELKTRMAAANPPEASTPAGDGDKTGKKGLRELRLGRPISSIPTNTIFGQRTTSLNNPPAAGRENGNASPTTDGSTTPVADMDTLILELVQAKTAEAEAKAETEVLKAKLEGLKRMLSTGSIEPAVEHGHRPSPSQPNMERSMGLGAFSSYIARGVDGRGTTAATGPATINTPGVNSSMAASGGSFWTGWGRRTASTSHAAVLPDRT